MGTLNKQKPLAFMNEQPEMPGEREKAIMATVHEIRNPLTAIKMANELMQQTFEKSERDQLLMQSYTMIIANNIERIEKHLKEALGYEKRELQMEPVNICDCIDKALFEAKDRLFLKGITVSNNYKGDHWVYGDAEKLFTAFLNIIVNGIEAIKTDNGKIWVSVYETNNSIRVTFKDNGIGMVPSTVAKIFDPSFSTKDGIGIGMYNVKEIMNRHSAHIATDSLPGIGTSISILFKSIPENKAPAKARRATGSVKPDDNR